MVAHVLSRYVWGYRMELARSIHDMSKQMYDSKRSIKAWEPLNTWLFDGPEKDFDSRHDCLTQFNKKTSAEFYSVVALCLWRLATSENLPWGRGATQPSVYSATPPHEKVNDSRIHTRLFFFLLCLQPNQYMVPSPCVSCVCQAWATATAFRKVMGKSPAMWMDNFPHHIWSLHRKIHHRYIRFHQLFDDATAELSSYKEAEDATKIKQEEPQTTHVRRAGTSLPSTTENVICLLSDSSEDDESAEDESDETNAKTADDEDESDEMNAKTEDDEDVDFPAYVSHKTT